MNPDDAQDARPADEPAPDRPMAPAVRWLARLAVVAIALRFIVAGFQDRWTSADKLGTVLLYAAVLLGVCSAIYALVELARRRGA